MCFELFLLLRLLENERLANLIHSDEGREIIRQLWVSKTPETVG